MDDVVCSRCLDGGDEDRLLICELCPTAFHIYCLTPALDAVPEGEWYCGGCLAKREAAAATGAAGREDNGRASRSRGAEQHGSVAAAHARAPAGPHSNGNGAGPSSSGGACSFLPKSSILQSFPRLSCW